MKMREIERLKQWRTDLQQVILEKSKEKRNKNKKYSIPGNTADFINGKNTYRKENGVWKQRNK
ncbi:hypothetical protein MN033_14160 [Bacillus nitratireducens]|uniref:hypothetical protein n=1 Tax=Bacillus nitratireducens TaxID=2026193 RepID=UPI001F594B8C|nr:hypothetical protein [Bacillus nitratireducens]UNP74450.1 hypothetical protein MN033_14160 [Bacillus nitratireducens]